MFAAKRNVLNHSQKNHPEEFVVQLEATRKYCEKCPKHFQTKGELELLMVKAHGGKYFFTCICGEPFIKTNYEIKVNRHRNKCEKMDKDLRCKVCDKQFIRAVDLQVHMRRHVKHPTINHDKKWHPPLIYLSLHV